MLNPKTTEVLAQWNVAMMKSESIPLFIFSMNIKGDLNIFTITEINKDFIIKQLEAALENLKNQDDKRIISMN
jgi:hypothetical protein